MGQLLFWFDAAVASVIWMAVLLVIRLLAYKPKARWGFGVSVVFSFLMWAAVIGLAIRFRSALGGDRTLLVGVATAGGLWLLGTVLVVCLGRRRLAAEDGATKIAAAAWPRWRLSIVLAVVLAHMVCTLLVVDYDIRRNMQAWRREVRGIAQLLSPAPVPDSENAAVLYERVHEHLTGDEDPRDPACGDSVAQWLIPDEGPFDPTHADMLAFLEASEPQLVLLREAGRRPACNFGVQYDPPSFDYSMEWCGWARRLGRLLCLSAKVNAHQGQMGAAMDDLNACFAMARHCSVEPSLIGRLTATSLGAIAFDSLQYALTQGAPTGEDLRRIDLSRTLSYSHAFSRSLFLEEAMGLALLSSFAPGPSSFPDIDIPDASILTAPLRVFLLAGESQSWRQAFGTMRTLAARPYHESHDEWKEFDSTPRHGFVVSILLPSLGRARQLTARGDAQHRVALVALAMLRHRDVHGSYPSTVDALIAAGASIPAELTIDPFTGRPLTIAPHADGRTNVYSIGPDLDDDDGRPPVDCDYEDADIVLTLPAI